MPDLTYYERIAAFLSEYLTCGPDKEPLPPKEWILTMGIARLLEDGVFSSPAALRKAALQEFDVIIRDDLFPEEDETE